MTYGVFLPVQDKFALGSFTGEFVSYRRLPQCFLEPAAFEFSVVNITIPSSVGELENSEMPVIAAFIVKSRSIQFIM